MSDFYKFEGFMNKNLNTPAIIIDDVVDTGATTPVEEKWVWVKGYKGTDANMRCKGYRYEMDKQFDMPEDEEINICHSGFHFCEELRYVFDHYRVGCGNRFFEVEALVRESDIGPQNMYDSDGRVRYQRRNTKLTSKSIKFVRELTVDEVFAALGNNGYESWTDEMKKRAMETSLSDVRREIRAKDLIEAGYSEKFAQYVARDSDRYDTAMAVASQPGISMDVKVMAIFMNSDD